MNVRTILSLALVAFVFALGGCATASRDSSYDSKADGTVKKTEKATCTGWGCSDTSTSRRHAPTVYVPGQYAQGYLGGYDTGIGRAYGYGHQVGDTPRDLAAQGFTYTPPNGYVQGLRKQWSYAQHSPPLPAKQTGGLVNLFPSKSTNQAWSQAGSLPYDS